MTSAQGCRLWAEIEQLANEFSCNGAHGWGGLKEEDGFTHPKPLAWMSLDSQLLDDFVLFSCSGQQASVSLNFSPANMAMSPLQPTRALRDHVASWRSASFEF